MKKVALTIIAAFMLSTLGFSQDKDAKKEHKKEEKKEHKEEKKEEKKEDKPAEKPAGPATKLAKRACTPPAKPHRMRKITSVRIV